MRYSEFHIAQGYTEQHEQQCHIEEDEGGVRCRCEHKLFAKQYFIYNIIIKCHLRDIAKAYRMNGVHLHIDCHGNIMRMAP